MPAVEITQKTITKAKGDAKPGAPRYEITDTRARGLRLRVGPQGVIWQYRYERDGRSHRVLLGAVDDWSIAEARELATELAGKLRIGNGIPDDWVYLQRQKRGKITWVSKPWVDERKLLKWTLEHGIKEYLTEVERTLKPATYNDYKRMLGTPELRPLMKRSVATISRGDLAEVVAAVHKRGVERHAEHLASVLRPLWSFLERDDNVRKTGVTPGEMKTLAAPRRSRVGKVEKRKAKYVPPMLEVGRILAIAQSGAFNPTTSLAMELLVLTCQRISPVAGCRTAEFDLDSEPGWGLWAMPALHRKTAEKRGDLSDHVLPLPPDLWKRLKAAKGDAEFMFPAARPRRAGQEVGAMAASNLSHGLRYMPDVQATPHDLRRAFAVHGRKHGGWALADTKIIIDHNEGVESGDVTRESYDLDHRLEEKRPMMQSWSALCTAWAEKAKLDDPRLTDHDWLKGEIQTARDRDKKKTPKTK